MPFKKGCVPWNKGKIHWLNKGKYKRSDGYIDVYSPDHPHTHGKKNGPKYVFEHRLVMEKFIGRFLNPTEIIHHINEIRDDNRIENLQLIKNNAEHRFVHGNNFNNGLKKCSACFKLKPLKKFPHRLNNPKHKTRRRYYSSWCYECSNQKRRIKRSLVHT